MLKPTDKVSFGLMSEVPGRNVSERCSTIGNIDKKFLDSVSPDEYVPIRPVTSSVRGKLVPVAVPRKKFSIGNFEEDNYTCQNICDHSSCGVVCLAGYGRADQSCLLRCSSDRDSSVARQRRRNLSRHGEGIFLLVS